MPRSWSDARTACAILSLAALGIVGCRSAPGRTTLSSQASTPPTPMAQGPGFATEGSLEKEFIVHIYRFTASPNDEGALVQLHPATTTIDVTVKDPPLSDHLQVCPVAPGYREHPRTGPCS